MRSLNIKQVYSQVLYVISTIASRMSNYLNEGNNKIATVIFNGDNYEEWVVATVNHLRSKKLYKYIRTGATPPTIGIDVRKSDLENWQDEDEQAMGKISERCASKYQEGLQSCTTALEVWNYIKQLGELDETGRTIQTRREFAAARMLGDNELEEHLATLERCQSVG